MGTTSTLVSEGTVLIDRQRDDREYIVVHVTSAGITSRIQICSMDGDGDLMWISHNQIRDDSRNPGYVITAR